MRAVGLRELKNRLSEYVREVRSGNGVLVTDRGQIVAELGPPGRAVAEPGIPPALSALAGRGLVTLGAPNAASAYPALPRLLQNGRSTQLLDDERGDR